MAASSAFPPVLSPLQLKLDPARVERVEGNDLHEKPYTSRVVLTDGGVYDNLGLETVWKRYDTVLVSDGGGQMSPEPEPKEDWARHAYRVRWDGHTAAGEFVTAPEPERAAPVVLLWSGDLGGSGRCRTAGVGYHIFRAMAARRPDFFVFLGDTVYADGRCRVPPNAPGADFRAEDLVGFRAKHRYQREDPALGAFLRLGHGLT